MVVPSYYFRVKELKTKDQLRKSKRNQIHFSKKDQEISELAIIFNQEETLQDLSNGRNISPSKDKKESC